MASRALQAVIVVAALVLPGGAALGEELVGDSETFILDHLNGATVGTVYGTPSWGPSLPELDRAVGLTSGNYIKYDLRPWSYDNEGTLEMWVKPQQQETYLLNFNWRDTETCPEDGHVLHLGVNADGKLWYNYWNWVGGDPIPPGETTIPVGRWTYVAASWGPAGTKLYVNGEPDAFSGSNLYPDTASRGFAYLNAWGDLEQGVAIDELHISTTQRTDAEIMSHYLQTVPEPLTGLMLLLGLGGVLRARRRVSR